MDKFFFLRQFWLKMHTNLIRLSTWKMAEVSVYGTSLPGTYMYKVT